MARAPWSADTAAGVACPEQRIGHRRFTATPKFMVLRDLIGDVFRTLWAHKLRTFLTMFGIAWG
ncbi:MAG TPA: hypothetical protein VFB00_01500, partial [Terriglobales bacterium]|nr:hypothetical protein [Terriglobales bacterium]